jgi:hypothetical protein
LFAFALLAFAGGARAETEVRVLATHPAGDSVTLGRNQTFYLHLGDPTSHNLWPFEILQVGVLSLVAIGVLLAARKFSGAET